jgi:REP element-mobilizing transposase RayT
MRHRSRAPFERGLPCHVTLRVRKDVPSLRSVRLVEEVERTFARGCERGDFRLVHYSLQGNHAHLVVEAADRRALGRGMMALGARLARAVNRVFQRSGPVLADRYHLTLLKNPTQVRNAIAYVLLNARRHAAKAGRKLSRATRFDPASSARWFDGWRRPLAEDARASERPFSAPVPAMPPVARPRGWLLRQGWRRLGLLDPDDVPGRPTLARAAIVTRLL